MGEILKQRLKMSKFESPVQEATLALMAAASELRVNFDRTLAEANLTGEQFNILRILRGAGPEGHPSGEIGCRMVDRSPDITRRIDALEKQEFVERDRSVKDRRVVRVRITKKGLDALDDLQPKLEAFDTKLTASLSNEELILLAQLCEKIIEVESKNEVNKSEVKEQTVSLP